MQDKAFLVSEAVSTPRHAYCRTRLVEQARLAPRGGSRCPRVHDLRHGFAVTTLLGWYRDDGCDVAAKMPLLSAYLGHANPASTYWYLESVPELMALAARRLEPSTEVRAT